MASSWYSVVVAAHDIRAQARSGLRCSTGGSTWTTTRCRSADPASSVPTDRGTVPEGKTVKNRLHLDLNPTDPEGNEFGVLSAR